MKRFTIPLFFWLLVVSLQAAERIALVIGNNSYKSFPEAKQLTSPRADAEDLAAGLRAIGFTVLAPVLDGTRDGIVKAKAQFLEQAKDAEIALFYFSGHGFQVGEENFLIPSDMPRITSYTVLKDNALMLRDSLMVGLEETGAKTKVMILDCCRDNPFAAQLEKALNGSNKSLRTKGGTGEISGYGPGFYLAFATSPGTFADDGNGKRNSPFTSALLTHLKDKAGENIRDLFDEVKETVRHTSGLEQVPWTNDSLSKSHLKVLAKVGLPAVGKPTPTDPLDNPKNEAGKGMPFTINGPNGDVKWTMRSIPSGSFMMGSPSTEEGRSEDENGADGKPVLVTFSNPFWMGETEVTQSLYAAVLGQSVSNWKSYMEKQKALDKNSSADVRGAGADQPMHFVSAVEADAFIMRLNQKVTLGAKWKWALPREAQWEYACRGGSAGQYTGSVDALAWYSENSLHTTHAVGTKTANAWGLKDMHGNVCEWCLDSWDGKNTLLGGNNPLGANGSFRVLRGGSWLDFAQVCRSADRRRNLPSYRNFIIGFRVAVVPADE